MPDLKIQDNFTTSPPPGVYARLVDPLAGRSTGSVPALLLDRDGVINEEVHYLDKVEDLIIRPGIAARIGAARRSGQETVIVTNQAGIGRGYYDWNDFQILQNEIYHRLIKQDPDAKISMTCACPFHGDGVPPFRMDNHPWRKPNAGMIHFAADALNIDLSASHMIGDQKSDEEAAARAGLSFQYA